MKLGLGFNLLFFFLIAIKCCPHSVPDYIQLFKFVVTVLPSLLLPVMLMCQRFQVCAKNCPRVSRGCQALLRANFCFLMFWIWYYTASSVNDTLGHWRLSL